MRLGATDPRHCATIVDRFNGTIVETGADSYRLATTRAEARREGRLTSQVVTHHLMGGLRGDVTGDHVDIR